MKRGCKLIFLVLLCAGIVTGCRNSEETSGNLYYIQADGTGIEPVSYQLQEKKDVVKAVEELLLRLSETPEENHLKSAIGQNLTYTVQADSYHVVIDFSKEYYDMGKQEEVLTRAAIVKTLLANNSFYYVLFYVDGKPLVDSEGKEIGSMNQDSFVENPGKQINASIETTLTLYFASPDGTKLVAEERKVKHSSNISLEKLVMQQLIEGPKKGGSLATIPPTTKIFNIAVSDHTCYVNLDESFKNQNVEIVESIVLYSIVNSLTQLPEVQKVSISINGDNTGVIRLNKSLAVTYERDLTYIGE